MSSSAITTVDPRWEPLPHGLLYRLVVPLLSDERDQVFVRTSLAITFTMVPCALLLMVPGVFRWWLGIAYLAVFLPIFMDRYILMLHATSHRALFKRQHGWLNHYIPWGLGLFFGQSPASFYVHHIGMHHPENNCLEDLSTTLPYKRDDPLHFLHYWTRFNITGHLHLVRYLRASGRTRLLKRFLVGELAWFGAVVALLWLNPAAAFTLFVVPFLLGRVAMVCGNWAQHAFVDAEAPENCYRNSITLVNSRHNKRCYNDGYHVVHHLKQALHWSEMPDAFQREQNRYGDEGAILFDGLDSYMTVFGLLMRQRYDLLADRFVQLGDKHLSKPEIEALLRARVHGRKGRVLGVFELA